MIRSSVQVWSVCYCVIVCDNVRVLLSVIVGLYLNLVPAFI